MTRSSMIRKAIEAAGGNASKMYINGPRSACGHLGVVSYVICNTGLTIAEREDVADQIKQMPGVDDAYVTPAKKMQSWMATTRNIKVKFNTRADGRPA